MSNVVRKAKNFAVKAHGEQKYGEYFYIVHLHAVADILKPYGDIAMAIGYLHDVIEDTPVSKAEIESEFGSFIAECVGILSDEPGHNRKERKAKTYSKMEKVALEFNLALVVKAADRLANIKSCQEHQCLSLFEMYRRERDAFKTAVYRPGLCDELWYKIEAVFSA